MSHSKLTKRGKSLYLDNWNPSAKKYINNCYICGATGYDPSIEQNDFLNDPKRLGDLEFKAIYSELLKCYKPLFVDEYGRCTDCAERMDER